MKKCLWLSLLLAQCAFAQNTYRSYMKDATTYREHPLDITRMKVEVSFVPEQGLVKGKVTHTYTVIQQHVDSVFFDAPGIAIRSAQLNGAALTYHTTSAGVWVVPAKPLQWDQTGTIVFDYEARPRKGIYFIGWNTPEPKTKSPWAVRKQVWTQGQGVDNRYWIPMYDDMNDKFITETVVTFDAAYQVLSNGTLLKKSSNKDNTTTWHYSMNHPHAGYLLMLGIGKYAIKEMKSARGVPLHLYYYPEFPERAEPTYRYSARMIDFLEGETGVQYPWESYSQIMVQDFLYGAMENTTATIFGDFFNVDERAYLDRNYVGVNCHELTHQWFGDYITARDGRDTWLQESYATYFPKMFTREIMGEDEYNWARRSEQNQAIDASKKDRNPVRHTQAGTPRVYPKGSNVISMLSYVLGEEQWKRALNHYLRSHPYASVETNDLVQAIQDKLGKDMSWFFDQWIYRGGEPHYTVRYEDVSASGSRATAITVEQSHVRDEVVGFFKMPIVFEVHYKDGSSDRVTEWIDDQSETVRVPNKKGQDIAFVLFDPNSMVMKTVTFRKSYEELTAQLLKAPNMLDRYDALVALRDTDKETKREALLTAFQKENFHGMRTEIVTQLINDPQAKTAETLKAVFSQSAPGPKVAAIKNIIGNEEAWKSTFEKALTDSSYDVVLAALEKLCRVYPEKTQQYLDITKDVYGMNNAVKIKWHEIAASNLIGQKANTDALVEYASGNWEFRTRNNAFTALKSLNYLDEKLVNNLFDAMLSTNSRLAGPAGQLAEAFSAQGAYRQSIITHYRAGKWEGWQKEQLKKHMSFLP